MADEAFGKKNISGVNVFWLHISFSFIFLIELTFLLNEKNLMYTSQLTSFVMLYKLFL